MSDVEVLPKGWANSTIPDLISNGVFKDGDWIESKDQDPNGNVRLIQLADIGDGYFISKSARFLTSEAAHYLNCTYLKKGDVLVARMPDPLGRACLMPVTEQPCVTVVDVCIIRGNDEQFSQKWLIFFINSPDFRNIIASLQSGSTRKRISRGNLSKIQFPIPPRNEQTRIVEKLEELLSDLDDGIAELKTAQIKLGQYRQSLLKSAVDGSLTTEWRKQNSNKITETGEQLLTRILKERRQHWEKKKLAEFAAKDKVPPKNWQAKYPEPVEPDTIELPELPKDWVWATIDQLAINKRYGSSSKTNDDSSGIPVLRMGNIQNGELDYGNLKYLPIDHNEFPNLLLNDGDLLFNRTNSAELVGKSAIYYDKGVPTSYASYLISISFTKHFKPELAAYFLNSALGKKWLKQVMNQTAGQANVNGTKLGVLAIPLPPVVEQQNIIQQMKAIQEQVNAQIEENKIGLNNSDAQRKNILKDAFTGKLVPQDPNDEPASILLEKIKAERAEQAKQPKPKRTKRKSRAMKKMDSNTLKLWVNELKQETFTFAELQKAFSGDYEELKEALFALLAEPNAVIEQIFDDKTGVLFQRTNG